MYPKLFLKNYRLYILIFFFTFFTRLPVILLFDFTDPGSDSIYYINFAENLLSNQKYQLDFVKPGFSMDDIPAGMCVSQRRISPLWLPVGAAGYAITRTAHSHSWTYTGIAPVPAIPSPRVGILKGGPHEVCP